MKKIIIIAVLIGAAVFGALYMFSSPEITEDSLKKSLSDKYSSFKIVADYMIAHPDKDVIDLNASRKIGEIKDDFAKVNAEFIQDVWNKNGTVEFNTGDDPTGGGHHGIIYSPNGKPSAHPDAVDAGKDGWFVY